MKKYVFTMLAVFCLVFTFGNAQVSAQHFDYDEAWQILNGKWIDSETGKAVYPVWKSNDGSECNIVNGEGYTNPTGTSKIYFDRKGVPAYMIVTYYPDQNKYYAKMVILNVNAGKWHTYYECLAKE